MRQKSVHAKSPSERIVKNIRRATRKRHSSEEKIRIVLDGLRGESSIAELCRREGIAEGLYYAWSKEFLEAGKRRLAGDTARAATSGRGQGPAASAPRYVNHINTGHRLEQLTGHVGHGRITSRRPFDLAGLALA